ncbi:MAG: hypothetical protein RIB45_03790 [Marivibrio sp.]|uniref:hypothetical protein n=1 Tax=Marivibrio sp. TaxID=2039719 RepID=UPI0032F09C9E
MTGTHQSAADEITASHAPAGPGALAAQPAAGTPAPAAAFGSPRAGGDLSISSADADAGPDLASGGAPDSAPDSARPDQMAAIRARKAEREKEQAARDKAARARKTAADQAAERQREDRLKALARRNAAQAPQRPSPREGGDLREIAQEPPGSAPLTPQGATVDDRIRSLMRDPRYWRERDPGLLDHVTRQWRRAYPGVSRHVGFKRPDPQPAIRPGDVEPWPARDEKPKLQKLPARPGEHPPHPRPMIMRPGWRWNGWTGRWERMTPEEAAEEQAWLERGPTPLKADAPAPDHNSGLSREDALDALRAEAADGGMRASAFLKEAERIREAYPDDGGGEGVQVAAAELDRLDRSTGERTARETPAPAAGETRKERRDKRGRMEPQSSIPLNSLKYEKMHDILQEDDGAVRSHWFGAAADVTSLNSLGALDSPAGELVDDRAASVMRAVHHKLAPENFALFDTLRKGDLPDDLKGLSGKALDYALVEREQALVQKHLDAELAQFPEAERPEVTAALSRLINLSGLEKRFADLLGDTGVRNAVKEAFGEGGFDFSQRSHREALGKAMIDLRYEVLP